MGINNNLQNAFLRRMRLVIPAKARKIFEISPGDQLVVLGDERQGLAIMKSESFLAFADAVRNGKYVE